MNLRTLVPTSLKRGYRLLKRAWTDHRSGMSRQLAKPASAKEISNIQRPMTNIQLVRVLGVSTYIRH